MLAHRNGARAEKAAAIFLKRRKFKIIARNYRCEWGEIDIIALKKDTIHFIEVKSRMTDEFGSPEEYVTDVKQDRVTAAAKQFMYEHKLPISDVVFDVISVTPRRLFRPKIKFLEGAF